MDSELTLSRRRAELIDALLLRRGDSAVPHPRKTIGIGTRFGTLRSPAESDIHCSHTWRCDLGRLAMTLASSVILVGTLSAQLDRGSLAGIVSDPSGASVANAQIKATHLDTNTTFSTLSSESGNYTLPALAIGRYRILVKPQGSGPPSATTLS